MRETFSLTKGPASYVLDGRLIAVPRAGRDSGNTDAALADVDPNTIKRIEIIHPPEAQRRFPGTIGDVVNVDRCFSASP
jgi:hypothetical protein